MDIFAKINEMSDNEILSLFKGFSGYLVNEIQYDSIDVIRKLPNKFGNDETLRLFQQADIDKLEFVIKPEETVPAVRTIMEQWAKDPDKSIVLEQYMNSHQINTLDAGVILAIGSVLVTTIVSSSLKVEYKKGKLSISYDSSNISDNAVNLVKAVLTKLPESIKEIFHNKHNSEE